MENIKDMLSRLMLLCRLEVAIVKELEDLNKKVYALEENRKAKDTAITALQKEVANLKLLARKKV